MYQASVATVMGSRGEVLHLLQMEVELLGDNRQLCHIFFGASRMAAYEVRYDLLSQVQFLVQAVEYPLEAVELFERRFTHYI